MANVLYAGGQGVINASGVGTTQARFSDGGLTEIDPADTNLVAAVESQGGVRVDVEGTEEALTAGTVQTAVTCSAVFIRNGAGTTVFRIYNDDANGELLAGPFTIAANAERVMIFPTALDAPDGVFFSVASGAFNATPGHLIP